MNRSGPHLRLALLVLVAWLGCHGDDRVLVIEKTKTFHTKKCTRIFMAHTTELSVAEAEHLGCRPCPGCQPLAAK